MKETAIRVAVSIVSACILNFATAPLLAPLASVSIPLPLEGLFLAYPMLRLRIDASLPTCMLLGGFAGAGTQAGPVWTLFAFGFACLFCSPLVRTSRPASPLQIALATAFAAAALNIAMVLARHPTGADANWMRTAVDASMAALVSGWLCVPWIRIQEAAASMLIRQNREAA